MGLPGRQDELVERIAAANPNTVVVVNAGSPVTMDWAADDHAQPAAAVVTSFFAGQEQAEAMVDVLLGEADPAGRLPVTYPQRLADTPAFEHHEPVRREGEPPHQRYEEGLFIGHRHYERHGVAPRFWFGHGLSYGSVEWGAVTASQTEASASSLDSAPIVVSVPMANVSGRSATSVVQCYVAPVAPSVERPIRELKAWSKAAVSPGAEREESLRLDSTAFHHWDVDTARWMVEPGEYDVIIATSADPDCENARIRITLA